MRPLDFVASARRLVPTRGKPSQADLRRATSSAYYALFHCLARASADLFVGGRKADRSQAAWLRVYRSLDHGLAKNALRADPLTKVHKTLADFGDTFVILQDKRHQADYDPSARFTKSVVLQDITTVEQAVVAFQSVPEKDRRAFCAYVLFRKR